MGVGNDRSPFCLHGRLKNLPVRCGASDNQGISWAHSFPPMFCHALGESKNIFLVERSIGSERRMGWKRRAGLTRLHLTQIPEISGRRGVEEISGFGNMS